LVFEIDFSTPAISWIAFIGAGWLEGVRVEGQDGWGAKGKVKQSFRDEQQCTCCVASL